MQRFMIAATAALTFGFFASADPSAENFISNTALAVTQSSTPEIELTQSIDVDAVARFTLGKYSRRVSDVDKARFEAAYQSFLEEALASHTHILSGADVHVVGSIDRNEHDCIVETRLAQNGQDAETIRWRVIHRGGEWRVVDVEWRGLWLAIEQRAQINAILDKPRATIEDAITALKG